MSKQSALKQSSAHDVHEVEDIETHEEPNLKGTFAAVMFIGVFIVVSWIGVYALYMYR
ncbi:cytochrome c oxidase subunit 2A [Salinibacillus xinjiangensis]|uniref:Cytochrome c oxidase subunit 2A n=1 Tax=Salinibacillus xinjiangensis TaxID=1229268 RepID=A0A6G1XBI0_9BACI|nr:cytochrome c oxidase subunit 2A [Salinibacillus xinjiangensis]MRG88297.1 cytochrome c oxidase subunit 2A [Salinibacillus xinjiangensis]